MFNIEKKIKKNNLRSGVKRYKKGKEPSTMVVLKEDCQAFGVIVSKLASKEVAFAHPITSAPLAVATPEGEQRQSD